MDGSGYRSYMVRVWLRDGAREAIVRVLVEEVQTGRQVELRGERARELAAGITAALDSAGGSRPPRGA